MTRLANGVLDDVARLSQPALDATPAQIAELADLTDQAAAVLGDDTTRMLHAWLAKTRPGA